MTARREASAGLGHLLLGQPDLAEQYMRALALKGTLPGYTGGEFDPSITVLDLTDPEYGFLRRQQMYQAGINQAALAANFNYLGLGPITSARALCVVERIVLANTAPATATSFWVFLSSNNLFGAGTQGKSRDDRQNKGVISAANRLGAFGVASFQSATDVRAGEPAGGPILVNVPAASTVILDIPFVLTGNLEGVNAIQLLIQSSQVNVPSAFGVTWRERAMVASELT